MIISILEYKEQIMADRHIAKMKRLKAERQATYIAPSDFGIPFTRSQIPNIVEVRND